MHEVILELIKPENLLLYIFAYGLAATPTSYVVARIVHGVDIKKQAGYNHTASYLWQTVSKWSGILVFCFDMLKGLLPCAIAYSLDAIPLTIALIGFFSVLGHCFSVWLKFYGGHGSITLAGSLIFLYWPACVAIFLMNALLFSLQFPVGQASMIASLTGALVLFLSIPKKMVFLIVVLSVGVIILRHQKTLV